jgi:hypothetical protein
MDHRIKLHQQTFGSHFIITFSANGVIRTQQLKTMFFSLQYGTKTTQQRFTQFYS